VSTEPDTDTDTRQVGPVTTAATAAAAGVLIVCYVIETTTGHTVPLEVQGAATVCLVAAAGWLVPPRSSR
jgi:hypothetical protein